MFAKLLVANRGEIAIRVMRACRDLGISPVAIYSDLDADALHVRVADEAYNVGPGPASESYLNIANIVAAARRCGAEAVHPGYGFLAENARFAQAVMDAGLAWVGPAPGVIDRMGDKVAARRTAEEAGVPTVPGTPGAVSGADEVEAFARQHGFPVALKASAGGGGKGFRVVQDVAEIEAALSGAAREAEAYFGDPAVYVEKYLHRPKHIEIQVLGLPDGSVIAFPERDCSLQRRHQKLVEESPCAVLAPEVRSAIMGAAARLADHVDYRNAGTCEFLLDADRRSFYFLEMNTRLQVEHPVTELVTGIDLVVAQIQIAAGQDVGFSQDDIGLHGHAIECRINAENPARNFVPSPGRIGDYREPAGPGVRVDSGVEPHAEIPQVYDPLVSKLITYGSDREQARRRMLRALAEYRVEGIKTSIPFHALMLADDSFIDGEYHTGTVENELDLDPLKKDDVPPVHAHAPQVFLRRFSVEVDGKHIGVVVREPVDGAQLPRKPRPPERLLETAGGAGGSLVAPMQGTIVKVNVKPGDEVAAGDEIVVLEAMKMENSIKAHSAGIVEEVRVEAGQSVDTGATLAVIR